MSEIVKVNAAEYNLEESKAKEIEAAFVPMLAKMTELEDEYNEIIKLDINAETCAKAKTLRLKYVKVRTGTAAIHKERKAYFLSAGRCVDGWKNAQLHASQGIEEKLAGIEKHFENIEAERIKKLNEERSEALKNLGVEFIPAGLAQMEDEVWEKYLSGAKIAKEQQEEAERKAEEERIAKEKAEAEERERIRLENEKLKREAAEREKKEAEERAERERIEKEREAKEKAEREKREKAEAKQKAEYEAKIKAEREERERLEREQAEKEAKEKAEREAKEKAEQEEAARVADKEHRKTINNQVKSDFENIGIDSETAIKLVKAIAGGKIENISINY